MIGMPLVRIQSSLLRGGSQTVKASVLYTGDLQVQPLPALRKGNIMRMKQALLIVTGR